MNDNDPWIEFRRTPGPYRRVRVLCPECGHQPYVGIPAIGAVPRFGCGECSYSHPTVEITFIGKERANSCQDKSPS